MTSGRTYEVFIGGKLVKVGSTTHTLEWRRKHGYTKQFGPAVELHLIREVPRPVGYSDRDYDFYLKACEAFDIVQKKTYQEDGGLNKISPLIQALGGPMLEAEMGRIGGRIRGPQAVKSGQFTRLRTPEHQSNAGRAAGRKNIESGHIQRLGRKNVETGHLREICTPEVCARGGRIGGHNQPREAKARGGHAQGCKNVKSGHLAKICTSKNRVKGLCQRWNINRGKPCACGQHYGVTAT